MGRSRAKNGQIRGQPQNRRSTADKVLAQGVGCITQSPFGNKSTKRPKASRKKQGAGGGNSLACWDAKLPQHLALPRPVGAYLTVRLTRRFKNNKGVNMFCFFRHRTTTGADIGHWSNMVALSGIPTDIVSHATTRSEVVDPRGLGEFTTWTPAAMTVQVMNGNSLDSTNGIIYGGVSATQIPWSGSTTRTWQQLADEFIQYQSPRLMSAGKLCLRGVQASTYPLSMSQISEFTEVAQIPDQNGWAAGDAPCGFAPIVVVNQESGVGGLELEYLVTTEWRVRFDLQNPASSAHVHHPLASDQVWESKIRLAEARGAGMVDIVEAVANSGRLYS